MHREARNAKDWLAKPIRFSSEAAHMWPADAAYIHKAKRPGEGLIVPVGSEEQNAFGKGGLMDRYP